MEKKNPPEDFCLAQCSAEERLKYEVAKELGIYEKVLEQGWGSLTAKETGKIGGMVAAIKKKES